MPFSQAKLIKKIQLTEDVFELHYDIFEMKAMLAGQFITFIIPTIWGRAYSILELQGTLVKLIIKRWGIEMWGRWGSIFLCDAKIWDSFSYVWPAWHFILQDTQVNKLFLGTGTGLVPLYNQILFWLAKNTWNKYQLVFWVRYEKDLLYLWEFKKLKEQYPDTFYYHLFVSRDEAHDLILTCYLSDFISERVVEQFQEFYICGAPAMIDSCHEKIESFWVHPEQIFFEKY